MLLTVAKGGRGNARPRDASCLFGLFWILVLTTRRRSLCPSGGSMASWKSRSVRNRVPWPALVNHSCRKWGHLSANQMRGNDITVSHANNDHRAACGVKLHVAVGV